MLTDQDSLTQRMLHLAAISLLRGFARDQLKPASDALLLLDREVLQRLESGRLWPFARPELRPFADRRGFEAQLLDLARAATPRDFAEVCHQECEHHARAEIAGHVDRVDVEL